jgi:hypothetical protein
VTVLLRPGLPRTAFKTVVMLLSIT